MNDEPTRADWDELLTGLSFGLVFGLVLHRAGVTNYDVIVGTLLLRDMVVLKVMMTAVVVGAVGVYTLRSLGLVQLHLVEASFGRTVIGGIIFGVGFGLLGYCPGTAVGAAAEGRLDALLGGVVGMLIGSFLFALDYPTIRRLWSLGNIGEKTLWQLLRVDPWVVIVPMCAGIVALLWWLERIGR